MRKRPPKRPAAAKVSPPASRKRVTPWLRIVGPSVLTGIVVGITVVAFSRGWFAGTATAQPSADLGPAQVHSRAAPGPVPEDMVWVPGGVFYMGSDHIDDAMPVHKVQVDGFWMDRTEVTNAQFQRFVDATGYVTVA